MTERKFKVVDSDDKPSGEGDGDKPKAKRRANRPVPPVTIEEALPIAKSIADNNAGRPYSRLTLADTLQRSPDSSSFRDMITASFQYGLTKGSYKAPQISLTELGQAIVMPTDESEVRVKLQAAFLAIPLFSRLAKHFDSNKIPQDQHFRNTLIRDFHIDPDWAVQAVHGFIKNARFVGIVRTIAGAERIDLSGASSPEHGVQGATPTLDADIETENDGLSLEEAEEPVADRENFKPSGLKTNNVFITHGHNNEIVAQVKEILQFGKFAPIIAEERETTSRPVPDKVLKAMQSCFAGVIHVEDERNVMDQEGNSYQLLNQNVLVEIGAAMALYGNNFVLLVKKGVNLPSNLQGLYRCEYEGEKLDYEATMKLLRTFNEFEA